MALGPWPLTRRSSNPFLYPKRLRLYLEPKRLRANGHQNRCHTGYAGAAVAQDAEPRTCDAWVRDPALHSRVDRWRAAARGGCAVSGASPDGEATLDQG